MATQTEIDSAGQEVLRKLLHRTREGKVTWEHTRVPGGGLLAGDALAADFRDYSVVVWKEPDGPAVAAVYDVLGNESERLMAQPNEDAYTLFTELLVEAEHNRRQRRPALEGLSRRLDSL